MKTAIIAGGCDHSSIGSEILDRLMGAYFKTVNWSRCVGVDLLSPIKPDLNPDVVVHVAETGQLGLCNVWEATKAALEKNAGVFIGLSSVHHLKHNDSYANSKRLQEQCLIVMAKHSKVRVNTLRLGHISPSRAWPQPDPTRLDEIPLGRFGTPQDVAEAVMFMVNAKWMTGSVITLDGGMSLF